MSHPFLSPDFHVRWSTLLPEAIVPDMRAALGEARGTIGKIRALSAAELTYQSTFPALEKATEQLGRAWGLLHHLDAVADSPAQREGLTAMIPEVTEFYSSIPLDAELWLVLKAAAARPEIADLDPVEKRFVAETLADFRQAGADLAEPEKKRVAEIEQELSLLTKEYSEHVLDSTNAWELVVTDQARLAGLPESAVSAAAASARSKGHGTEENPAWRFTLHQPSLTPVMQYADDESLRREVWEASIRIGAADEWDNTGLVWKILQLRQEKAEILGHAQFADFALQRRMARTGSAALGFIEDLHGRIKGFFGTEYEGLRAYKAAKTGTVAEDLEPWEVSYWSEKQRKELYDLDEEELRPFFPISGVMTGMFGITERIFGIRITGRKSVFIEPGAEKSVGGAVEVWHPEVSFYDIHDAETGAHLGSFYADWHPRESKRGGAWMNSLHTGGPGEPHLGLMVGNMTPPVDGKMALFTHSEVETVFHEFGHLLHGMLSEVPVKSLSGTNVAWDFVELPSQIMENFCWDRESLDLFAKHHETGETIPDALFAKMIAARNYMEATGFMRQLSFAKLDLELHLHPDRWQGRDLDEVDREILSDYRVSLKTQSPSMLRRFGHLFSSPTGYASGYYSYKWAEVLDADAFTRFQEEGILNPATGRDFRMHILSKGNSAPPDELYRRFMGRDPDLSPLLTRSGLTGKTGAA
ncbi:MAG: M3 family metallopeptidase [Verrucomicrobiota bacterium]